MHNLSSGGEHNYWLGVSLAHVQDPEKEVGLKSAAHGPQSTLYYVARRQHCACLVAKKGTHGMTSWHGLCMASPRAAQGLLRILFQAKDLLRNLAARLAQRLPGVRAPSERPCRMHITARLLQAFRGCDVCSLRGTPPCLACRCCWTQSLRAVACERTHQMSAHTRCIGSAVPSLLSCQNQYPCLFWWHIAN